VDENKQEPKGACFEKKNDFEPNTHIGHQGITPMLQIQNVVKLHKAERWKVRLSADKVKL